MRPAHRDNSFSRALLNWWSAIYLQACAVWGTPPDPEVLAYAESYETRRADLQALSGSG
ncbi:MAG TPA: hypothetical protein VGY77_02965 [Gemmataceae bacterium]|nr:hypothetical protein [Gemmataceae bacterium]